MCKHFLVSPTEKLCAELYVIVGLVGIFCAVKLIVGVRRGDARKLLWWMPFQVISIVYQIFISTIAIHDIEDTIETESFGTIAYLIATVYNMLELYMLLSIFFTYGVFQEAGSNFRCYPIESSTSQVSELLIEDEPPTYDEAVKPK